MSPLSQAKRELLKKYLGGQVPDTQVSASTVARRPCGEVAPLSFVQEQVWRRSLANRSVPSLYNESVTLRRIGELDFEALERALTEIVRRHESWRTTFTTTDGCPVQVVHPAPSRIPITVVDLCHLPIACRENEALRFAREDAARPFDLEGGPLVRPLLVAVDRHDHRLFLTAHQSVVDGISVYRILPSELTSLYHAFTLGLASPLPDLQLQQGDFAYWEREVLPRQRLADHFDYWRRRLDKAPIPFRWPKSGVRNFRGALQNFTLSNRLSRELNALNHREGVTLFMSLAAAFAILLSQYSGENDIVMTTMAPAGRKHGEVQQLLGYFINPVALRVDLSGQQTVRDLLRQVRDTTSGALCHDDIPFEYVMSGLDANCDPTYDAASWMAISLAPPLAELPPGWSQTPMDVDSGWAKWDMYLELSARPTEIVGRAQYKTEMFTPRSASRFIQAFLDVLTCLSPGVGERISNYRRLCPRIH